MEKLYIYIALCVLSAAQICAYSVIKLRGKGLAYTVSKCAGSAIFLLTAIAAVAFNVASPYTCLILGAFALSAAGDYFLSLDGKKSRLKLGAGCFASAHCVFIAAFCSLGSFHWLTVPITLLIFAAELLMARLMKLKFYGIGVPAAMYILTVTAMAVQACSFAVLSGFDGFSVMSAVGAVLFLVSDLIWVCYGLSKNSSQRLLKVLNVVSYFPAQMLLAGALLIF